MLSEVRWFYIKTTKTCINTFCSIWLDTNQMLLTVTTTQLVGGNLNSVCNPVSVTLTYVRCKSREKKRINREKNHVTSSLWVLKTKSSLKNFISFKCFTYFGKKPLWLWKHRSKYVKLSKIKTRNLTSIVRKRLHYDLKKHAYQYFLVQRK